jgi:2Fe-2S ferredoxin
MDVDAEAGDSVMNAAVRGGVPGIEGECGGEMSCATCHVYVEDPTIFISPSPDELDLLELADDRTERSRLGCQLKIKEDIGDFEVRVPEA